MIVAAPQSLAWFARHELLLAWRDWLSMMTAGRRTRERIIMAVIGLFAVGLHLLAYAVLKPLLSDGNAAGNPIVLVTMTGCALLAFFVMLSQALESVTRAFYTRSDLELILSSPTSARNIYAVRIVALTLPTAAMSTLLMAPFINLAAALDHPGWLASYVVMAALAMFATAVAVWLMVAMFELFGAKRTRLIAQIVAAIIGASILIGMQVVAIMSYNTLSRISLLRDSSIVDAAPSPDSIIWLPVQAAMGGGWQLAAVLLFAAAFLGLTIWQTSKDFGDWVVRATGIGVTAGRETTRRPFRQMTPRQSLKAKEFQLLKRDPWLVSQSLMQVLYLLPPALLLWKNYGDAAGLFVVLSPVLVMALGQLAGGLAWLTISGEDAPALVATAPVSPRQILFAKIESVLVVIGVIGFPMLAAMATFAPAEAMWTAFGVIAASASAIAIQLWFRGEAKRSHFRYRQVASRVATLTEAFSSLSWAAATALLVAGHPVAVVCIALALLVLTFAWLMSPGRAEF